MEMDILKLSSYYTPVKNLTKARQKYFRVFLRITLGASRLQEILADRYAALAYGAQNFIEGLRNVIRQSVQFDFQVTT
jgi:hypothetical protein